MSSIPSVAKAWRYPVDRNTWNGYKSLELRDVEITPPKRGEVLVKLHAASLNYREYAISQKSYPGPYTTGPDGKGLIPACDGAGEIVALGDGVTEWKTGDRVHSLFFEDWLTGPIKASYIKNSLGAGASGCLTQYRVFRADTILAIPDYLSYEEASTIPCAALTAWTALFEKRRITKDSTVLVLGSGGVSVVGAQLAKAVGARVIATTSSKEKAEKYKALGVDAIINYRETPEWFVKVRELTGGEGVEQVLEVGGQGTLVQSIKSIQAGGIVHLIGFLAQGASAQPEDVAMLLLQGQGNMGAIAVGSREMGERLDAFLAEHKIKPVIDRVFEWTEAVEAMDCLVKAGHFGKIVIKIE